VSACLLGINCRYDNKNSLNKELLNFLQNKEYVIACPEQLGGLSTPRRPCEIIEGDGDSVLNGNTNVENSTNEDVTDKFLKGAEETLKIANLYGAKIAILKSRSPSCGSQKIYDGTFEGKLKEGIGVTTALLRKNNILVLSDENYEEHIK